MESFESFRARSLAAGADEVMERRLGIGDTFHIPAGSPHDERYGPEGAAYWVARRNAR
jgi:hypothetical protein